MKENSSPLLYDEKELIFSARTLGPDEALVMGLLNHVFAKENFMQQVVFK